jgi:hypothetical protein
VAAVYGILRLFRFQNFFSGDAEGIGALLQIVGTLYSVVYAFAIYVIWGQFTAVENEVVKEAASLKDLMLFSRSLGPTTREPMVRAVKVYARLVVEIEWRALARGDETEKTARLFQDVIASVTDARPEGNAERVIHERLLGIASEASGHRDERIALSVKRIPRTLLLFVTMTAFLILFLLLFYPFHNAVLGLVSMSITTMLLFFAHFVLTDLDNPFEGAWNAGSGPFAELLTKFR